MKETFMKGSSIALYIYGVKLWKQKKNPRLFCGIFALHLAEYFIAAKKIGEKAGVSKGKSLALCLLFGFTWWLPIKKALK